MWSWLEGSATPQQRSSWDPLQPVDEERRTQERVAALAALSPSRQPRTDAPLPPPFATPVATAPPVSPRRVVAPVVPFSPFATPVRAVPAGYAVTPAAESPSKALDFQNFSLLVDYRHLASRLPRGMHVSPGAEPALWGGIYFPRAGPFAGGAFRFSLELAAYPLNAPRVVFATRIVHPLVSPSTGVMDLSHLFTPWVPQRHRVWHLLQAVDEHIAHPVVLDVASEQVPSNSEALRLLRDEPRLFAAMAAQCVAESQLAARDVLEGRVQLAPGGFDFGAFNPAMLDVN